MKTLVIDMFGLVPVKGDIGIEVEVEGRNLPREGLPPAFRDLWRIETDGSLRGESNEYVLRNPVHIKEVQNAINVLKNQFKESKSVVNDSVRCGVHVHTNVQNLSILELATFITCYLSVEELLIQYCSPSRRGNHFCLRAGDAEYLTYIAQSAFDTGRFVFNDDVRYAAMNLLALQQYGSLEFRALETPPNLDKIVEWAKILHTIKESSKKFNNPVDVIEKMSDSDGWDFVENLLGNYAKLFVKMDRKFLLSGVRNAQSFAYGVDWGKEYKDPKAKKKVRASIE